MNVSLFSVLIPLLLSTPLPEGPPPPVKAETKPGPQGDLSRPIAPPGGGGGAPIPFLTAAPPAGTAAIQASLTLRVPDREGAIRALLLMSEDAGGYLSSRQDDRLTLRVPTSSAGAFLQEAEGLGQVADRTYAAQDRSQTLREAEARLKSSREMMTRYFELLDTTSAQGVIQVEAELSRIIGEVERLEGQLRLLRHQLAFADLDIRFEFEDRRRPVSTATTSFPWVNDMNLAALLADFGRVRR